MHTENHFERLAPLQEDALIISAIREECHALTFDKFVEKHKLLQQAVQKLDAKQLDFPPEFNISNLNN